MGRRSRAIKKLQNLYDNGKIDIGVFVTSKSKHDGATRIWPVSNRNGSFEELRNRDYTKGRTYPFVDISFWPDGYDQTVPYISATATYEMNFTGETEIADGEVYLVATNPSLERKLVPAKSANSKRLL